MLSSLSVGNVGMFFPRFPTCATIEVNFEGESSADQLTSQPLSLVQLHYIKIQFKLSAFKISEEMDVVHY